MRQVTYQTPTTDSWRTELVPEHWPDDAVAEVLAFRSGLNPGDIFELVPRDDGRFQLLATGSGT